MTARQLAPTGLRLSALVLAAAVPLACVPGGSPSPRLPGEGGEEPVTRVDAGTAAGSARADASQPAQPAPDSGLTKVPDAGFADAGFADSGVTSPPPDAGVTPPPPDAGMTMPPLTGVPVLGNGRHTMDAVELTVIAEPSVGHDVPTDLAFHPIRANELWVVNQGDSSVWIVTNVGTAQQQGVWRRNRSSGPHFLAKPSGIAFAASGDFATSQDEDRPTQSSTPADFMGPTLWTSNMQTFDGGDRGHIDMLHNSPRGKGIAWERDNVFWYFDGYHNALTRYDFHSDHGPGGSDHTDGEIARFVEGQVAMSSGVPSHMEVDRAAGVLYVADTGNNRIATMSTRGGTPGRRISPNYDGCSQYRMDGMMLSTLIDGAAVGLRKPVGLELHDGMIFVSDNETSRFYAFSMTGDVLDYLDTGLPAGSLMGMAFDAGGRLYFVDAAGNRVLRVAARTE